MYLLAIEASKVPNGALSRSRLRNLVGPLLERPQAFDDFLSNALHAGVLMETEELPKYYQIPIPAFGELLAGPAHRLARNSIVHLP